MLTFNAPRAAEQRATAPRFLRTLVGEVPGVQLEAGGSTVLSYELPAREGTERYSVGLMLTAGASSTTASVQIDDGPAVVCIVGPQDAPEQSTLRFERAGAGPAEQVEIRITGGDQPIRVDHVSIEAPEPLPGGRS